MKRILATTLFLAFSTGALAQAPESPWRSPFTAAPSLSGVSPLNTEKNRQAREQDLAAWRAARGNKVAARPDRTATAATADRSRATAWRYKP
jgi:hypothetical protein